MKKLIVSVLSFSPVAALAATNGPDLSYLENTLTTVKKLVGMALPIVVGLSLLAFFWGVFQFIWGGEGKRDEGKQHMIWGIVGLFVMVSVWGLIGFLGNVTGVNQTGGTLPVPNVTGVPIQ